MIKNILFDFGDVFINLDKGATLRELSEAGYDVIAAELYPLMISYEKGLLPTSEFVKSAQYYFPGLETMDLISAWNAIILDFPEDRLTFLKQLAARENYRLFLLSNTNDLHITKVKKEMGEKKFNAFRKCFEGFYLSHELKMRKPDAEVFLTILENHSLKPNETLFVDDTLEHIVSADRLGLKTWHLQVGKEAVTDLDKHL
ncbi:HAD family hydrolase [Muriicola soli]|uniref:HAD family phosphatase n=1 Tax=Muriicola soli TaxID=2507538 RepID=A0A411E9K9_9FLAO|nr:HAD family phosphatase [Muriicola soli]QBA64382.1 HAD family phosphatase [Muriicola soli]